MQQKFSLKYESRGVVIEGTATVFGDYDGASKPRAMIVHALGEPTLLIEPLQEGTAPPSTPDEPPMNPQRIMRLAGKRNVLVQVGTQVYELSGVADDTLPHAIIFATKALLSTLDDPSI